MTPTYIAYCIVGIALATTGASDVVANQNRFSADSIDVKMTKQLNLEIGGGSEMEKSLVLEILGVKKELGSPIDSETAAVRTERASSQNLVTDKELLLVIKELYSEISALKKNLPEAVNSPPISECLVESSLREGKSHPVGISYRRLCPSSVLNREVQEESKKCMPRSCMEVQANGNNVSGIYEIQPKKSDKPFEVLCDMETQGGGWTVIQKRYDGSVDFYRQWREYKFGFGDLDSEFWMGMDNIYNTMTGYEGNELLLEIVDRDNNTAYAHYKSFEVGSEPESYSLKVLSGFSGNAGDSLKDHVGMKFSARDYDQDLSSKHCAAQYGGGWWFKDCLVSNLNGYYVNLNLGTRHLYEGIQWKTYRGQEYGHAKSRMMIRPREL